MKKLLSVTILTLALFVNAMASSGYSVREERMLKKSISKFATHIQNVESAEEKEKLIGNFLERLDKAHEKMTDSSDFSKDEVKAFGEVVDRLNSGFGMVNTSNASDLDEFASYVESEVNQAYFFYILIAVIGGLMIYGVLDWAFDLDLPL